MQHPSIWFILFETESIPLIDGHDVNAAQEDFQFMYLRTFTAKQMAPLRQFVGIAPRIDQGVFEIFRTVMDPYEPPKKMNETWIFVVEPESIYRKGDSVDDKLLKALKNEGDFKTNAETGDLKKQEALIP